MALYLKFKSKYKGVFMIDFIRRYTPFLSIVALLFFSGCILGWPEYKAAIKCDLKNDGTDCIPCYQRAIRKNPELPGIYSSYGSYLLSRGNISEGQRYLKMEAERHPEAEKAVSIVLKPKTTDNKPEVSDTTNNTIK
jgi:hypothetical protein